MRCEIKSEPLLQLAYHCANFGLEYLFALDQKIVVEAATVQILGGDNDVGRPAVGDQYALGIRYQRPISPEWIVRADAMYGWLHKAEEVSGLRMEIRRKFWRYMAIIIGAKV